jgi:hypothetical protein
VAAVPIASQTKEKKIITSSGIVSTDTSFGFYLQAHHQRIPEGKKSYEFVEFGFTEHVAVRISISVSDPNLQVEGPKIEVTDAVESITENSNCVETNFQLAFLQISLNIQGITYCQDLACLKSLTLYKLYYIKISAISAM